MLGAFRVICTPRVICTSRGRTIAPRATMDHICVFAPTDPELRAVEEHLRAAGPVTAGRKPAAPDLPPDVTTLHYGGPSPHAGAFDPPRYFDALDTACLGRTLLAAGATASTQAVVQDNVVRLPDGVLFVADRQLGGKGRGGNVWDSPPGCLMFSAVRRLGIAGQRLPFVQYLVTLAVVQGVEAAAARAIAAATGAPPPCRPLNLGIKWPNDIYAGGLKLGGILCHSSFREGKFHIIMGVGLNLANREPTTCVDELVAVAAAAGGAAAAPAPVAREELLAEVMTRLEPMLELLSREGFGPFEGDYLDAWLHSGQRVGLEEEDGDGGVRFVDVTVRGLSPNGYLMAEDDGGQRFELHPDGNSFDFFKGLVRKKLPA